MKKRALIIVVVLMAVTALAFANGGKDDMADDGVVTIQALMNNSMAQPPEENPTYKAIEEEFGVKFEFEMAVGSIDERIAVLIASQDFPDITDAGGLDLWAAGALLPIEDYMTDPVNYPNLTKHYAEWTDVMTYSDGHIYRMPNDGVEFNNEENRSPNYFNPGFWMKIKVLEDAGWPELPTTVDEFMGMIEAYAAKYGTTEDGQTFLGYEILGNTSTWRWHPLRDAPSFVSGYIPEDGWKVDEKKGTVAFDRLTDSYHDYYMKVNEMYNKGLVDPSFATNDFDEWMAANRSGRTLGFYDMSWQTWWSVNDPLREAWVNKGEANGETFVPLAVTLNEGDSLNYFRAPAMPGTANGFALFNTTEHADRIMAMFDGITTESWQKRLHWGIEGQDYMVDDTGKYYLTDEQRGNHSSEDWKTAEMAPQLMSGAPAAEGFYDDGNGFEPQGQPDESRRLMSPMEQEMLDVYGIEVYHQLVPSTEPDSRFYSSTYRIKNQVVLDGDAAIAFQQIEDHQKNWLAKLVTAKPGEFESMWNEYAAGYDEIDIDAVIDEYEKILMAAPEYDG